MNIRSFFSRLCHSRIACLAAVALATLAWSNLSFAGDIYDAARAGDLAKVKALLKNNPALAFSEDNAGATPLHIAAEFGHKDVADILLANKADVNAKDNMGATPLHKAAMVGGAYDVAELLLANRADVNARDNDLMTPLDWAAHNGDEELASLLRQHGGH
jgi:cytohesin